MQQNEITESNIASLPHNLSSDIIKHTDIPKTLINTHKAKVKHKLKQRPILGKKEEVRAKSPKKHRYRLKITSKQDEI